MNVKVARARDGAPMQQLFATYVGSCVARD
jgi:hypothetical protein